MQRKERKDFSVLEPSLDNLTILIRERIFSPVIKELYNEFINNGTYQYLIEILSQIPAEYHPPILHTLATHVTKEKPVFIYGIGMSNFVDAKKTRFVAASVDLLWCLSLMVDDIIDRDRLRANKKTAWSIYGEKETYKSAEIAFEVLQESTAETLSPSIRTLLVEAVKDSLNSLGDSVIRDMNAGVNDILRNIDRRARFHCEYPIKALFAGKENEETTFLAMEALFCANRAGQILNDTKDLVPSRIYGRDLFADVRSGTVTIPLAMLREVATTEERQRLTECFNAPYLTLGQRNWLQNFVNIKLPRSQIFALVLQNYSRFLEIMRKISTSECLVLSQKWVDYKMGQAKKLLLN